MGFARKFLYGPSLVGLLLFGGGLGAEEMPRSVESAVEDYRESVERARKRLEQRLKGQAALAERRGDASLARAIRNRLAEVADGGGTGEEGAGAEPEGGGTDFLGEPTLDTRTARRRFHAAKAVVRDGELSLYYDFRRPAQMRDFDVPESGVSLERGTLQVEGAVTLTHRVRWTGALELRMEVAHANRKGDYFALLPGGPKIGGHSYNAWLVDLSRGEQKLGSVKFAGDYYNSGDLDAFRPTQLTVGESRIALDYGQYEGKDVNLAARTSGALDQARLELYGASGGASYRQIVITGTPDPEWLATFLTDED